MCIEDQAATFSDKAELEVRVNLRVLEDDKVSIEDRVSRNADAIRLLLKQSFPVSMLVNKSLQI